MLKIYGKYVCLNVKYSSEYKGYTDVAPNVLQNRARELVKVFVERSQRVSNRMIVSVKETVNGMYRALADDPGISNEEKEYIAAFGDQKTFCSRTCRDFRRTWPLFKLFFAVIESNRNITIYHNFSEIIILQIWTIDCLETMK